MQLVKLAAIGLFSVLSTHAAAADAVTLAPSDSSVEDLNKTAAEATQTEQLPQVLEIQQSKPLTQEQAKARLASNPAEFEKLLSVFLLQGNHLALKDLLPTYQAYSEHDPSVIEWGNAIIDLKEGRLTQAIAAYRKLNSALPEVKSIQFQMALALYQDRQFEASKSQFEKIRVTASSDIEKSIIEQYLDAIARQDRWTVSGNFSFLNDKNLNNAPETGTSITTADGAQVTFRSPREEGQGVNLGVFANRRFLSDRKFFTEIGLGFGSSLYWNNKKYNDVSLDANTSVGYQTVTSEVSIGPFFNKRLYAGGTSGDGSLGSYLETVGGQIRLSHSITPNWRYSGAIRLSQSDYIPLYDFNNSDDQFYSSNLIYLPNQLTFFLFGLDYMDKKTEEKSDSFERQGIRLGWGQTWPKGISTRVNLGYAERDYQGANFFGVVRENQEYSAELTLLNRNWHYKGLTPQLVLSHYNVDSTSAFEVYQKNNVSIELTKEF